MGETFPGLEGMWRSADFSICKRYRYTLNRVWDVKGTTCVFILLNPSTATEIIDDPTNRRGIGFARKWGCGACVFVNLFAFRTPKPKEMKSEVDPIGPMNDAWIENWADLADILVAAWGTHGTHRGRDQQVIKLLEGYKIMCLGKTKHGHPKHPLYLRSDTKLEVFRESTTLSRKAGLIGADPVREKRPCTEASYRASRKACTRPNSQEPNP